jgi:hypothetical protein
MFIPFYTTRVGGPTSAADLFVVVACVGTRNDKYEVSSDVSLSLRVLYSADIECIGNVRSVMRRGAAEIVAWTPLRFLSPEWQPITYESGVITWMFDQGLWYSTRYSALIPLFIALITTFVGTCAPGAPTPLCMMCASMLLGLLHFVLSDTTLASAPFVMWIGIACGASSIALDCRRSSPPSPIATED